jgi:hypothetical protein
MKERILDPVTVEVFGKSFVVDRQKLKKELRQAKIFAKVMGVRPGQPGGITNTASDPISYEKFFTCTTILKQHSVEPPFGK